MFSNCQLPDLFVEAWNLCSSVTANCCDITSMNCDIKNSEVLSILDVEKSSWYYWYYCRVFFTVFQNHQEKKTIRHFQVQWKCPTLLTGYVEWDENSKRTLQFVNYTVDDLTYTQCFVHVTRTSDTSNHRTRAVRAHPYIAIFELFVRRFNRRIMPENFVTISLTVQELTCWQTNTQTDIAANNTTIAGRVVINHYRTIMNKGLSYSWAAVRICTPRFKKAWQTHYAS